LYAADGGAPALRPGDVKTTGAGHWGGRTGARDWSGY